MDMEIELAIELIDKAAAQDLEASLAAIRAGDQEAAMAIINRALSRLDSALDALRAVRRHPHDLQTLS